MVTRDMASPRSSNMHQICHDGNPSEQPGYQTSVPTKADEAKGVATAIDRRVLGPSNRDVNYRQSSACVSTGRL